jgi:transposase
MERGLVAIGSSLESQDTLFVALELSRATWLAATFCPRLGEQISIHSVPGGNAPRLLELIGRLRAKIQAKGVERVRVVSCYEAGYDGFWLHRVLCADGVENQILDAASLPVDRRAKRIKTDNIDAKRLLRAIVGHTLGDPQACRVIHVPSIEEENARRLYRERQRLVRERTGHINRIKALLIGHGIRTAGVQGAKWLRVLDELQTGDGRPLPAVLKTEIERQWRRLQLLIEHLREVEAARDEVLKKTPPPDDVCAAKIRALAKLRGIGGDFATALTREVFYRRFDNRKQVASYFGLTPAPYDSGETRRDQGINKAGNARVRVAAVQMAWMWLRFQPQSELSQWYFRRVGELAGRIRKIMIIALARKLVIALWRYVETGLIPKGAIVAA